MHQNLSSFLKVLAEKGQLKEITEPLDPNLEIPEIHRRVVEKGGPALLFKNPKGSDFPLVTNLFGTLDRVHMAFGEGPQKFIRDLVHLAESMLPPKFSALWDSKHLLTQGLKVGMKNTSNAPILHSGPKKNDFTRLPATVSWPEDGGAFFTLPLVYTQDPENKKHNLGIYRMHIHSPTSTGMHWQIHKGGGNHFHKAEQQGQDLPVTVFNGGPPALILSAIAPLPEDIPELLLASLVLGQKLKRCSISDHPYPLIAEADFAFPGYVKAGKRQPEGPFGDHYGYYSLEHDYPVFECEHFYHRKDAIFCATVVGEPPQEDLYLGDYLQDLLSPLFPLVMPAVKNLTSYGETGFHALAVAEVKVRYPKEALVAAMRVLGEGQLSLTKVLMVYDAPLPFRPFKSFLEFILARCDFRSDLHILSQTSMDTLDYSGPKVNEGSKMIWQACGEARFKLETQIPSQLPSGAHRADSFCPGCLSLETISYEQDPKLGEKIAQSDKIKNYRLVLLFDDIQEAHENEMKFLWSWFTRFEPAADTYARSTALNRFHCELEAPLVIDARMKPWYPGRLVMSPEIVHRVDEQWKTLGL